MTLIAALLLAAQEPPAPQQHAQDLTARFGQYYRPVEVEVDARVPDYELPLAADAIANLDDARRRFHLSDAQVDALRAHGFVVVPGRFAGDAADDFVEAYEQLEHGLPLWVSTDALLHLYQIQFDSTLLDIEEREFCWDIRLLVRTLRNRCAEIAGGGPEDLRDAADWACAYLSVADAVMEIAPADVTEPRPVDQALLQHIRSLAQPATAPRYGAHVATEVGFMREHQGFMDSPLFEYRDDYSQYVPRGHYTRSEILKRYFLGMMWLGRMTLILKGGEPHGPDDTFPFLVTADAARRQTLAGAILSVLLSENLPDGRRARDVWERLYAVTSYYVGLADDLSCDDYAEALTAAAGEATLDGAARVASDADVLFRLKVELARNRPPAIYSGTGEQTGPPTWDNPTEEVLERALGKTMGWRFMGQRFIPDSYWMGRLVYPTVADPTNGRDDMLTYVMSAGGPIRGFPRGLDVMAILGSARAAAVLQDTGDDAYGRYAETRDRLAGEIASMTQADWNRNLYWSWLYCLKGLMEPVGDGYPRFMRTTEWETRTLDAALASWAELRHATILYAKQSYTMAPRGMPQRPPPPPPGYVEPRPEFYARLRALNAMSLRGLDDLRAIDEGARRRLQAMDGLLERLTSISLRQLSGGTPTAEDNAFLEHFASSLGGAAAGVPDAGCRTTMVADVHTDQSSREVMEEGVGRLDLCIVAMPAGEGAFYAAAGPVFSYFEFRHAMNDRLTDEAWRTMLDGNAPGRPEWDAAYRAGE